MQCIIYKFECKNHIFIKLMIKLKTPNQFVLKCSSSKILDKIITPKWIKKKERKRNNLQGKQWQQVQTGTTSVICSLINAILKWCRAVTLTEFFCINIQKLKMSLHFLMSCKHEYLQQQLNVYFKKKALKSSSLSYFSGVKWARSLQHLPLS